MHQKKCNQCGEIKPIEDFYWDRRASNYFARCKKCIIQNSRKHDYKRTLRYHNDSEYRAKYLEKTKKCQKSWRNKMKQIWFEKSILPNIKDYIDTQKIARESEHFAAEKILPKEGFTNILETSTILSSGKFPFFDILAKKEGKNCGISVTQCWMRSFHKGYRKTLHILLSFLEMRFYILFVKPNHKGYILRELNPSTKLPSGFCVSMQALKSEYKTIAE